MFLKKYIWLSAATLLTACDLIDYHPYDGRLDSDTSREINPTNIERIEKVCEGKDTIRFIFMGDTQRSYNETEDFVKYVNQLDSIDFIIHGGDYTEFGLKKEFEWNDDILSKLKVPYVGLIGNHDVIGNGDQVFRKIFGNENFSFVVSDVKFVCLNTNAIEYDYSHPVPDFNFLKNEIADSTRNKRTIVVMHAPPGNEQFDNNVKDVFQLYIKTSATVRERMATGHPPLYKSTIRRFHGDAIRGYRLELLPESLGNGYVAGYRPPQRK